MASKNLFLAGAVLLLCVGGLEAQTYLDRQGGNAQTVASIPYDYWPLAPGQHNLTVASSTALTLPTGARFARLCASTATVRYTTDGIKTPTASLGQPLFAGACVELAGARVLNNLRFISSGAVLDVEYFQ
ncbi:MAG TPA: hypothetical protein VEH77_14405 [Roseiarcus sp.]|nr:hypothetical protein [Roseiarcus sp.]